MTNLKQKSMNRRWNKTVSPDTCEINSSRNVVATLRLRRSKPPHMNVVCGHSLCVLVILRQACSGTRNKWQGCCASVPEEHLEFHKRTTLQVCGLTLVVGHHLGAVELLQCDCRTALCSRNHRKHMAGLLHVVWRCRLPKTTLFLRKRHRWTNCGRTYSSWVAYLFGGRLFSLVYLFWRSLGPPPVETMAVSGRHRKDLARRDRAAHQKVVHLHVVCAHCVPQARTDKVST